jgi:hypothetical protein
MSETSLYLESVGSCEEFSEFDEDQCECGGVDAMEGE